MRKETILVIGAGGQIGVELTMALRLLYGNENVIASDVRQNPLLKDTRFVKLDVLDKQNLSALVLAEKVSQIYLLAAVLSANGEVNPQLAWKLNMQGLLNVLDVAKEYKIAKIFWPSSIAVFGHSSPKSDCPQFTIMEPATVYGISKFAGECWCKYYFDKYGVDVRSIRYPGLISHQSQPGGGTTDYAVEIFHSAIAGKPYTCFLEEDTMLPMMYMPDAIRATLELMEAPAEKLQTRMAYNISAMSFTPAALAAEIQILEPGLEIVYLPDHRQAIADSWPASILDIQAVKDWGWRPRYDITRMTRDMLMNLKKRKYSYHVEEEAYQSGNT